MLQKSNLPENNNWIWKKSIDLSVFFPRMLILFVSVMINQINNLINSCWFLRKKYIYMDKTGSSNAHGITEQLHIN